MAPRVGFLKLEHALERALWREPRVPSRLRGFALRHARLLYSAVRSYFAHESTVWAAALTYVTVLSLVPLLALAFSIAKGFGAYDHVVQDTIKPFLDETLGPAGTSVATGTAAAAEGGREVRAALDQVLAFVSGTDSSSLGLLGLIVLVTASLKLLSSIERAFNRIWGAERERTLVRKLTDYFAMVVVTPIALVTATGLTAAAENSKLIAWLDRGFGLDTLIEWGMTLAPVVVVWGGFTLVYLCMPNARTRFSSALYGGVFAGSAWHVLQVLHVKFQVGVVNFNAIYAGFAAVPIFLAWLYASWCILLLGAELAAASQGRMGERPEPPARAMSQAAREEIALAALTRLSAAFLAGEGPLANTALARHLGTDGRLLRELLGILERHGILAETAVGHHAAWTLARPPASLRVAQVVALLRGSETDAWRSPLGEVRGEGRSPVVEVQRARAGLAALDKHLQDSPSNLDFEQLARG
jgi:membrane protein